MLHMEIFGSLGMGVDAEQLHEDQTLSGNMSWRCQIGTSRLVREVPKQVMMP